MDRPSRRLWSRAFGLLSALLLGGVSAARACQSCSGAEDSPLIDGARLGAIALVLVTASVQGGFVGFFFYLRKRAKDSSNRELDSEWCELQNPSR